MTFQSLSRRSSQWTEGRFWEHSRSRSNRRSAGTMIFTKMIKINMVLQRVWNLEDIFVAYSWCIIECYSIFLKHCAKFSFDILHCLTKTRTIKKASYQTNYQVLTDYRAGRSKSINIVIVIKRDLHFFIICSYKNAPSPAPLIKSVLSWNEA